MEGCRQPAHDHTGNWKLSESDGVAEVPSNGPANEDRVLDYQWFVQPQLPSQGLDLFLGYLLGRLDVPHGITGRPGHEENDHRQEDQGQEGTEAVAVR